MVTTFVTFFSSFNPIVFCLILACGALIVFRRPAATAAERAPRQPRQGASAAWRRSH